jgi:hypothetical protein
MAEMTSEAISGGGVMQVTGAPRGYLLLGAQPLADSVLLTLGRRNR